MDHSQEQCKRLLRKVRGGQAIFIPCYGSFEELHKEFYIASLHLGYRIRVSEAVVEGHYGIKITRVS